MTDSADVFRLPGENLPPAPKVIKRKKFTRKIPGVQDTIDDDAPIDNKEDYQKRLHRLSYAKPDAPKHAQVIELKIDRKLLRYLRDEMQESSLRMAIEDLQEAKDKVEKAIRTANTFISHIARAESEAPIPIRNVALTVPGEVIASTRENFVLKGDQPEAFNSIVHWLNSVDSPQMFALMGGAGSGKSNLLRYLVVELSSAYNIHLTATTNSAVKTLAKILNKQPSELKTIYSHLGLTLVDEEDRQVLRPSTKYTPMQYTNRDLIVIDEGGMAPEVVVDYLLNIENAKILLIGDPFQLPPVKEKVSKAFRICRQSDSYFLMKKILRFDDSKLQLSLKLRRAIKDREFDTSSIVNDDGIIRYDSSLKFLDSIRKHLDSEGVAGLKESKVLAWRNKTVLSYNQKIRKHLNLEDPYTIGEMILLTQPIVSLDGQILAATDTSMVVEEVSSTVVNVSLEDGPILPIQCYSLEVAGGYVGKIDVPSNMVELEKVLARLSLIAQGCSGKARAKAWRNFWKVRHRFPGILYDYARTVHRAQGASMQNVWVVSPDILANPDPSEGLKCLYVACTRPMGTLHYL